ncbi:MAG: DNRLRE domain-containing protein [Lentisphaeraceae bacterium]|nr:DNRLRE domain-containing protein [Lentisphaeraceae bacterium]
MMDDKTIEELYILIDKQIDENLTEEEAQKLEKLILENEEARSIYMDVTSYNAMLFEQGLKSAPVENNDSSKKILVYQFALLAAAALIAFMFIAPAKDLTPKDTSIAVLSKTEDCEWSGSSLPTESGSKLGAGNLNLIKGLATVKFNSGAEVIIEAPAEIELINSMHCLVKNGTVMADVPDSAHGFTIDTPRAKAIDHGTKFVVSYSRSSEKSLVEVLEGEVEVKPHEQAKSEHFFQGHTAVINKKNVMKRLESDAERKLHSKTDEPETNIISIGTNYGRGMDQAIDLSKGTKNKHRYYLTVKHSKSELRRKSYMKFDLSKLESAKIKSVKFKVRAVPTGYGSASLIPEDVKFAVYGLTDESLDSWDENTIKWENAPANVEPSNKLKESQAVKLGEFGFKRSFIDGVISVSTDDLKNFIQSDTNGLVTLILVRESGEFHQSGLVHAFASKEHPIDSPPTLEFEVDQ